MTTKIASMTIRTARSERIDRNPIFGSAAGIV